MLFSVFFKAALYVFVATEQVLNDPDGPDETIQDLERSLYAHSGQTGLT